MEYQDRFSPPLPYEGSLEYARDMKEALKEKIGRALGRHMVGVVQENGVFCVLVRVPGEERQIVRDACTELGYSEEYLELEEPVDVLPQHG